MSEWSWKNLPSILIVEIFSFLSLKDRLRASMVCKSWRECLFHPNLWPNAHFQLSSCDNGERKSNENLIVQSTRSNRNSQNGAQFLAKKCGRFVQNVIITLNSTNPLDVKSCKDILEILSSNKKLETFTLRPNSCGLEWFEGDSSQEYLPDLFLFHLKKMLKNSYKLRHISLGCVEELLEQADCFLSILSQYHSKSLESLHLASVKEDPERYVILELPAELFDPFLNLKILSIDYDFISDNLLQTFAKSHKRPLEAIYIHVHGIDSDHPGTSDASWKIIWDHSPQLEVTLTLLHSNDPSFDLQDILHPSMPLVHFRSFFSSPDSHFVDMLAALNGSTLQSIHFVDGLGENLTPTNTSFILEGAENPLVMLAWRCHKLNSIIIIGYEIYAEDLIAIARLRGPNLKEIIVPDCCLLLNHLEEYFHLNKAWPQLVNYFIRDISQSIAREWCPLPSEKLHPSIINTNLNADGVYLSLLLEDQAFKNT